MKLTTRDIAVAGVMSAISVLLAATPLGFIPFIAGTSITIMQIPVIIGAVVSGPIVGTIIALVFGISSLIIAAVAPKGPGDVFFTDPLVSILPRIFIGVAAWGVYRLVRAAGRTWALVLGGLILAVVVLALAYIVGTSDLPLALAWGLAVGVLGLGLVALVLYRAARAHPEELALSLAAVAGTLTNTILVLGMLVLRGYIPGDLALAVGAANSPPEMIAAALITVAVVATWQQVSFRTGGSSV
ncbi:MAG: ECF transporter S component [Chloroflexi bacterium]|nr:ECF transporter S component [Chloroflexota bacterium]MBU1748501.1 ECF transporter S component [Chloroflexota bacterium]